MSSLLFRRTLASTASVSTSSSSIALTHNTQRWFSSKKDKKEMPIRSRNGTSGEILTSAEHAEASRETSANSDRFATKASLRASKSSASASASDLSSSSISSSSSSSSSPLDAALSRDKQYRALNKVGHGPRILTLARAWKRRQISQKLPKLSAEQLRNLSKVGASVVEDLPLEESALDSVLEQQRLKDSLLNNYVAWKDQHPEEHDIFVKHLADRNKQVDAAMQAANAKIDFMEKNPGKKVPDTRSPADKLKLTAEQYQALNADPELSNLLHTLKEDVLQHTLKEIAKATAAANTNFASEIAPPSIEEHYEVGFEKAQREAGIDGDATRVQRTLDPTTKKQIFNQSFAAHKLDLDKRMAVPLDPQLEKPLDWIMADAFVKPPVLPACRHLNATSASPLHRALHVERLRQTIFFLREERRRLVRERADEPVDLQAHVRYLKESNPQHWAIVETGHPVLAAAFENGFGAVHYGNFSFQAKKEFITDLFKHVCGAANTLFSIACSKDKGKSLLIPFPRPPRDNKDEVFRKFTHSELIKLASQASQFGSKTNKRKDHEALLRLHRTKKAIGVALAKYNANKKKAAETKAA